MAQAALTGERLNARFAHPVDRVPPPDEPPQPGRRGYSGIGRLDERGEA